jgi:hypothetical protein
MARTKSGNPVSTGVERASKSLDDLVARGGRRFNLKLSPEANIALKMIVKAENYEGDTAAINQTLIQFSQHLIENKS